MGCPKHVLDRSRIELYVALGISILQGIVPMSGFTRSLFLLVVLFIVIDVLWRSPWTHLKRSTSKAIGAILLSVVYIIISATLILREHNVARNALKTYVKGAWFFYLLLFLGGYVAAYLSLKLLSFVRGYAASRTAQKIAIQQKFRETQKGWLDYRVEGENSSKRLHVLIGRTNGQLRTISFGVKYANWIVLRKKPTKLSVASAHLWTYLVAISLNKSAAKMESNLEELRLTADLFIESTAGHLKICKQNYDQLASAREYFETQWNDVRNGANSLAKLPPVLDGFKGISQELTAAINRLSSVFRTLVEILRKVEGHCARMVNLAEARRDRALEKPLKQLASTLVETAEMMAKDADDEGLKEQVRQLRDLARSAGINGKSS